MANLIVMDIVVCVNKLESINKLGSISRHQYVWEIFKAHVNNKQL